MLISCKMALTLFVPDVSSLLQSTVMTTSPGFPHCSILGFFFIRSNRDKKILKVRKHGVAAVDAANMADIKIWCCAD